MTGIDPEFLPQQFSQRIHNESEAEQDTGS